MTAIAMRNLVFGLPPLEQLRRELDYANMKAPETDVIQNEQLKNEMGHGELWHGELWHHALELPKVLQGPNIWEYSGSFYKNVYGYNSVQSLLEHTSTKLEYTFNSCIASSENEIGYNFTEFEVKAILILTPPPNTNCYTLCKLNNVLHQDRCVHLIVLLYFYPSISCHMF